MVDFTMSLPNWRRTIERHTRLLLGWIMTDLVIRVATADDVPAISALVQHTVLYPTAGIIRHRPSR